MPETEYTSPLIYVGRRLSQKGPLIYGYATPPDGEIVYYKKPLVPSAKIGTILEVTFVYEDNPDEVSHYVKGPKAPRTKGSLDPDDERLIGWALEDKTAYVRRSQQNEASRLAKSMTHSNLSSTPSAQRFGPTPRSAEPPRSPTFSSTFYMEWDDDEEYQLHRSRQHADQRPSGRV